MSISGAGPPILPSPTVDSANGAESSCVKCSTPEGFPCSVPAPRSLAPWGTISASQSNEPVTSGSPVPASLAVALTRASRTRCGASSAAANVTSICAADPFASSLPSGLAITRLPASGQNRPLHCATASNLGSPPSTSAACADAENGVSILVRTTTFSLSPLASSPPDKAASDGITACQRAVRSNGNAADGSTEPAPDRVSRVDGEPSAASSRSSSRRSLSSAPPSSKRPCGLRTDGSVDSGHRRSRHVPVAATT